RDGRDDRQQGRRLRVQLREAETEGQRGYEQDAAADTEQAGEDAGQEAESDREQHDPHQTSSLTPTAASMAAQRSGSVGPASRCWSAVPAIAPAAAGRPTSAAAPGFSSPWKP